MHTIRPNLKRNVLVSDTEKKFSVIYTRTHPEMYGIYTILAIIEYKKIGDIVVEFYNHHQQHRTGNESVGATMIMMKSIFEDVLEYIENYSPSNITFVLEFNKKDKKHKNKFAREQIFTKMANKFAKKTGHTYDKIITKKSHAKYQIKFNIIYNDLS